MTSAKLKHLLHGFIRRAELYVLALGAERRCAMRLDRIGDRLVTMGSRINFLRSRIAGGLAGEAIDADRSLRAALKGLKEDIRGIRCQLVSTPKPQLSARLERAFARLAGIAEQTYCSADKLQWEIDEHDDRFAG